MVTSNLTTYNPFAVLRPQKVPARAVNCRRGLTRACGFGLIHVVHGTDSESSRGLAGETRGPRKAARRRGTAMQTRRPRRQRLALRPVNGRRSPAANAGTRDKQYTSAQRTESAECFGCQSCAARVLRFMLRKQPDQRRDDPERTNRDSCEQRWPFDLQRSPQ